MRKIENQARVLTLLGREGAEQVIQYSIGMTPGTVDFVRLMLPENTSIICIRDSTGVMRILSTAA